MILGTLTSPNVLITRARSLLALGRQRDALDAANAAARCAPTDAMLLDAVGTVRSYAHDQPGALEAYAQAVALAPNVPAFLYNRASARRFFGDLEGAESDYDRVIALQSRDFEAYLNRSELRAQSPERNHVTQLEAILGHTTADWRGYVQICYALAKEYEDLCEYARSFEHLRNGARARRQHMKYDLATDVATVDWIIEAFPGSLPDVGLSAGAEDPIFIVGLPRSGTTLVERILSSHSSISSAGELDCFALAIVDATRRQSGRARIGRQNLVALSGTLDFRALGQDYLIKACAATGCKGRFIDKMPLNYLYCGLIGRALPHAKIVHVTRHPMAVGYAMYKTLFKDGYPFSYDLGEIGRYSIAYQRLMEHWHVTMPTRIYELSYEDLVSDQVAETLRLLKFCDLEWEEACIEFHRNPCATTTASASQVRQPIYKSSISQWRHYEQQLRELSDLITSRSIRR